MNKNNIFIETLYEFKCTRRSILFKIFLLTIVGLVLYQFTPLSGMDQVSSINDLFHFSMDWVSQALPSSIAYKTAYYFNLIQLLFIIVFVANDSRAAKLRAMEPLHARPLGNAEIVIGKFLGKCLAFTMMNFIAFAVSILINVVFYPRSFEWSLYLFYWATLTLPTLVYTLGISYLVTRFVRHQGLSVMLLLAFSGTIVYWGAGWLNGMFDPCARSIPNMFSDFTGHVNLDNYLLQRGFTLLVGLGFLALSVVPYPRIPNHLGSFKRSLAVACFIFTLAGGLGLVYHARHGATGDNREAYKRVYGEHGRSLPARVVRNDLHVKELKDGGISVNSRMTVTNRTSTAISLVIYLNPGLKVNSLEIDGKVVSFRRDHQAVLVDQELAPGEASEVVMGYEGGIENDVCFLDVDPGRYDSPTVNEIGVYHFGYTPAFCERGYKLLTPECLWYPTCVPPYGESGVRDVNFSRYSLRVEHDPRLTAISQGNSIKEREGETVFSFDHDMPGISLCVGDYKKREITIDSTRLALYCLPGHEYLLEGYDVPEEKLIKQLASNKKRLENIECIQSSKEQMWHQGATRFLDPTQRYPYRWLTLLEVPCNFHCFPGLMQLTGEREQGGIVFIPEKVYSIKKHQHRVPNSDEEKEIMLSRLRIDMLDPIIEKGSCNIKPVFRGKTTFIFSSEYPIIHDIITNILYISHVLPSEKIDDSWVVEYLKQNSLKHALHDNTLSPEELQSIIHKKSVELYLHIMLQVRENPFRQFYHDFVTSHLFKEVTFEEYSRQFHQSFGIRLDSLVDSWYNADRLPLLDIRNARAIKMGETGRSFLLDILYNFSVFNRSDLPALVSTGDFQGWIIPPHEGREIRTRNRKDVTSYSSRHTLEMPLAQNLPASLYLEPEDWENVHVDTTTGVFSVDSSVFFQNNHKNRDEIIVDNEDPGCRVVKAKGFNIISLFREEKSRKKYYEPSFRQNTWVPTINRNFYGYPVRSAFYIKAGSGKQKVEWTVQLPQEGKYELFFHHVEPFNNIRDSKQVFHYVVFDGKEEHEVIAFVNEKDVGWISLGVFDFAKNAKVTLSDRDRKNKTETGHGRFPQEIVADAVKWVKQK